jgi:hypothetical protein
VPRSPRAAPRLALLAPLLAILAPLLAILASLLEPRLDLQTPALALLVQIAPAGLALVAELDPPGQALLPQLFGVLGHPQRQVVEDAAIVDAMLSQLGQHRVALGLDASDDLRAPATRQPFCQIRCCGSGTDCDDSQRGATARRASCGVPRTW